MNMLDVLYCTVNELDWDFSMIEAQGLPVCEQYECRFFKIIASLSKEF
jgi:hypothetical protein